MPQTRFKLSPDFTEALAFAAHLHVDQMRKCRDEGGTRIPYIAHLLGVASLVIENGGDEDEAIGALLHDSLEDQVEHHGNDSAQMKDRIRRRFGNRVLAIVEGCSDSDGEDARGASTWRQRKEGFINHLAEADPSVLLVTAADKLHNARCTLADLRQKGPAIWELFNAPVAEQLWYYRTLTEALKQTKAPIGLVSELDLVVREIEQLAAE